MKPRIAVNWGIAIERYMDNFKFDYVPVRSFNIRSIQQALSCDAFLIFEQY